MFVFRIKIRAELPLLILMFWWLFLVLLSLYVVLGRSEVLDTSAKWFILSAGTIYFAFCFLEVATTGDACRSTFLASLPFFAVTLVIGLPVGLFRRRWLQRLVKMPLTRLRGRKEDLGEGYGYLSYLRTRYHELKRMH